MVSHSCRVQFMIFVYKQETGTAITEICFSPSSSSQRIRKQELSVGAYCV